MGARTNGDQYKSCQAKAATVYVDITDGTAITSRDDHLREAVERNVHYVPEGDAWLPKPVSGATVKCAIPAWLV